ncbi:hypothetical protein F5880DRAFT_1212903 [Lentinula raphanica]|nr:hypothetical protein F5880DRAFT_1212903 [Lentinula raphanica]
MPASKKTTRAPRARKGSSKRLQKKSAAPAADIPQQSSLSVEATTASFIDYEAGVSNAPGNNVSSDEELGSLADAANEEYELDGFVVPDDVEMLSPLTSADADTSSNVDDSPLDHTQPGDGLLDFNSFSSDATDTNSSGNQDAVAGLEQPSALPTSPSPTKPLGDEDIVGGLEVPTEYSGSPSPSPRTKLRLRLANHKFKAESPSSTTGGRSGSPDLVVSSPVPNSPPFPSPSELLASARSLGKAPLHAPSPSSLSCDNRSDHLVQPRDSRSSFLVDSSTGYASSSGPLRRRDTSGVGGREPSDVRGPAFSSSFSAVPGTRVQSPVKRSIDNDSDHLSSPFRTPEKRRRNDFHSGGYYDSHSAVYYDSPPTVTLNGRTYVAVESPLYSRMSPIESGSPPQHRRPSVGANVPLPSGSAPSSQHPSTPADFDNLDIDLPSNYRDIPGLRTPSPQLVYPSSPSVSTRLSSPSKSSSSFTSPPSSILSSPASKPSSPSVSGRALRDAAIAQALGGTDAPLPASTPSSRPRPRPRPRPVGPYKFPFAANQSPPQPSGSNSGTSQVSFGSIGSSSLGADTPTSSVIFNPNLFPSSSPHAPHAHVGQVGAASNIQVGSTPTSHISTSAYVHNPTVVNPGPMTQPAPAPFVPPSVDPVLQAPSIPVAHPQAVPTVLPSPVTVAHPHTAPVPHPPSLSLVAPTAPAVPIVAHPAALAVPTVGHPPAAAAPVVGHPPAAAAPVVGHPLPAAVPVVAQPPPVPAAPPVVPPFINAHLGAAGCLREEWIDSRLALHYQTVVNLPAVSVRPPTDDPPSQPEDYLTLNDLLSGLSAEATNSVLACLNFTSWGVFFNPSRVAPNPLLTTCDTGDGKIRSILQHPILYKTLYTMVGRAETCNVYNPTVTQLRDGTRRVQREVGLRQVIQEADSCHAHAGSLFQLVDFILACSGGVLKVRTYPQFPGDVCRTDPDDFRPKVDLPVRLPPSPITTDESQLRMYAHFKDPLPFPHTGACFSVFFC